MKADSGFPPQTLDGLSQPDDRDERKVWFDYIKTLNERQLQESQRSGVTTYVLVGALIGLLYRFGPELPQFVARPGSVRASITIFVFLVVLLSSLIAAIAAMGTFFAGESEFRAAPKSSEASIPVFYGIAVVVGAALISVEVWVGLSSADRFSKYVLFAHALWLAVGIAYPVVRYRQLAEKAKDIRNSLPRFNALRLPLWGNLSNCAWFIGWLILGSIALIRNLGTLPNYGLHTFKAASVSLIAISIVGYMILRSLGKASQQKYFDFERDIVLNRMTPAEIKERYLRDLSGPDMAQWLDDAIITLDRKEEHLQREYDSTQENLKVIASINAEYRAERKERARSVAEKLRRAIADCMSQYEVLTFQTDFFVKSYKTQEESEALKRRFEILKERLGVFKPKVTAALKVLAELNEKIEG